MFVREYTSKMYSASAYFLSGWISSIPVMIIYPILTSSISFFFLGFTDTSFSNYINWTSTLLLASFQGGTFGFMLGCIIDKIDTGIIILSQALMWFLLGSGMFLSLKDAKPIVSFLGKVSPFRYSIERLMRSLLSKVWYADLMCEQFSYTYKSQVVSISFLFFVIFFAMGWLVLVVKARYM